MAVLGILYFIVSAIFGLGGTAAQILMIFAIIKSVKANKALKADPENAILAENAKKCKKNLFIWIAVAAACVVMVLCTYFVYLILLAIIGASM
ncbi:MAG: hypothetical protein E7674_04000 [Ruminococcaceae bacterium]|nr:hypothetical protein [Oscillospiraceae bacterium]